MVLVVFASCLLPGGIGLLSGSSAPAGLLCGVATAGENILPLKGLRVPVECYETGQVKVELKAERSDVHESGNMNANGVRVSFYDPTGRVETVVISDGCFFDKKSNLIKSDQPVRMERRGVVITGRGFVWDTASATVRILHDVCVVLDDRLNAMQKGVFSKTGLP
jgi:hypothetical protein